jgi:uncharacterized OsmC-like protein
MSDVRSDHNGIDVDALGRLAQTVLASEEPARLAVVTHHSWRGGAAVTGRGGTVDARGDVVDRSHHTFRTDLPVLLGGGNSAPAPTETLLAALAGCVASTLAEGAALGGIDLDAVESSVEGALDIRGAFGAEGVGVGLDGITITLSVRADVPDPVLEELGRQSLALSPTAATIAVPVPIRLTVRRLPAAGG